MSFKDILGKPVAVKTLRNTLASGRLSGTYLFSGPAGVGKRFMARTLAKALNCEKMREDACEVCLSCRKIEAGNHPDLLWIEPAEKSTSISIESIRFLKKDLALKPWEGRRRVVVLIEAERATEEAQNAFLKMLEETPESTLIILTSVKTEGILPTVLSRCKQVRFEGLASMDIQEFLKKRGASAEEAAVLSRLAHGSLGKALSMKEENFLEKRLDVFNHFLDRAYHIDEERDFFSEKEKVGPALDLLTSWYRDLWVVKEGGKEELLLHEDRFADLEKESGHWSTDALFEALSELLLAQDHLEHHVNLKILLSLLARRVKALRG